MSSPPRRWSSDPSRSAAEREEAHQSTRFAGQQVNPQQSSALFAARGWSTREGIDKLFRRDNLMAGVTFDHGYGTPGEVEGPPGLDGIRRTRTGWRKPRPPEPTE